MLYCSLINLYKYQMIIFIFDNIAKESVECIWWLWYNKVIYFNAKRKTYIWRHGLLVTSRSFNPVPLPGRYKILFLNTHMILSPSIYKFIYIFIFLECYYISYFKFYSSSSACCYCSVKWHCTIILYFAIW